MIQIIVYDVQKYKEKFGNKYQISRFDEIQALDDFNICIIDLTDPEIWQYDGSRVENVNCCRDLFTIKEAISNSRKSKILIVFPQNLKFKYHCSLKTIENEENKKEFLNEINLKDSKESIARIISTNIFYSLSFICLAFEKTKTQIDAFEINSDFNFINVKASGFESITFSKNSNKITTIKKERTIITTLDLLSDELVLQAFIEKYLIEEEFQENVPEWLDSIVIFDEEKVKDNITQIESAIKKSETEKIENENKLKDYSKIKSILYETDKALQNQVSKMLCDIFNYSDPDFVDEGEEDFRIKLDDVTFLIETKGLTKNLAGTDVSKLFNHVEVYLDTASKEENVKGLLIVATERLKKPEERNPIPDRQILIAKRNGLLIISTEVFLKIYENFMNKKIFQEDVKKAFIENIGNLDQI